MSIQQQAARRNTTTETVDETDVPTEVNQTSADVSSEAEDTLAEIDEALKDEEPTDQEILNKGKPRASRYGWPASGWDRDSWNAASERWEQAYEAVYGVEYSSCGCGGSIHGYDRGYLR